MVIPGSLLQETQKYQGRNNVTLESRSLLTSDKWMDTALSDLYKMYIFI